MTSTNRPSRLALLALTLASVPQAASAQRTPTPAAPAGAPTSGDEGRERQVMERFLGLLEKAPRRGTALEVWNRLERLFPDDLRVQEQIATALAEESQPEQALPRYEALAKRATDDYARVQFKLEAAELKVRLGRSADALADLEGLLG